MNILQKWFGSKKETVKPEVKKDTPTTYTVEKFTWCRSKLFSVALKTDEYDQINAIEYDGPYIEYLKVGDKITIPPFIGYSQFLYYVGNEIEKFHESKQKKIIIQATDGSEYEFNLTKLINFGIVKIWSK